MSGPGADILASYAAAAEVTRFRARNFYYGLRLTPEPRRSAVYAIYAWMRAGDDAVDEASSTLDRREALARLARLTDAALSGDTHLGVREPWPVGGAWWPAFADAVERYGVPRSIFDDTLAGLEEDAEHRGYQTLDELEAYARRVASTAGRACVRVWGVTRAHDLSRAEQLADELGVAFQLTNICRDVREDATLGRCYVPAKLLAEQGLTQADLLAWRDDRACRAVLGVLIDRAAQAFGAADQLQPLIARDCRATLWAMTEIYRGVLEAVARDPRAAVQTRRARVATVRKVGIMLTALAKREAES